MWLRFDVLFSLKATMTYQRPDGIAPHGGELINRIATPEQKADFLSKAASLPIVHLDERAVSDLQMIAIGGFSPLTGFMGQADYNGVVKDMHLSNGLPWSIPITLSVTEAVAAGRQLYAAG
jgi:sulfate adenylyltransferase